MAQGQLTEVFADHDALRVVEHIGAAGDVVLLHPLTLHVAAPNNGAAPRFLLSGAVTTDMQGWVGTAQGAVTT